jgi:hypothetical protein
MKSKLTAKLKGKQNSIAVVRDLLQTFATATKAWVRKSQIHKIQIYKSQKILGQQIRKVPHLRKVRKFNKLLKSENLRFAEFICGSPTFAIIQLHLAETEIH